MLLKLSSKLHARKAASWKRTCRVGEGVNLKKVSSELSGIPALGEGHYQHLRGPGHVCPATLHDRFSLTQGCHGRRVEISL